MPLFVYHVLHIYELITNKFETNKMENFGENNVVLDNDSII